MLKIDLDPCQACTCIVQIGLVEHSLRIHLELPAEAQRLAGDACSARKQTVRQIQASCHSTMYRKRDREIERERERKREREAMNRYSAPVGTVMVDRRMASWLFLREGEVYGFRL